MERRINGMDRAELIGPLTVGAQKQDTKDIR